MTENNGDFIDPITLISDDRIDKMWDIISEGVPQVDGYNQLDLKKEIDRRRSRVQVPTVSHEYEIEPPEENFSEHQLDNVIENTGSAPEEPEVIRAIMDGELTPVETVQRMTRAGRDAGFNNFKNVVEDLREKRKAG